MAIIGYIAAIFIGISIGLVGAGGSILTVPILVYLFDVPADQAAGYSLFVVGLTSAFAAWQHGRLGNLNVRAALIFACASIPTLLLVRRFVLPQIPDIVFTTGSFSLEKNVLLMSVFACLMLVASFSMIKPSAAATGDAKASANTPVLLIVGFLVGMVTGFLGAGGGFLIVPSLVLFGRLSMKSAVGTSLLIIFLNSLIGFAGDAISGTVYDWVLLSSLTAVALAGMLIGIALSKKIDGKKLKPAFGVFVLLMGMFVLLKEWLHF